MASSQPVTWPLRASELAKLMWQVPGRAELLERLPGATAAGAEMTVTRLLAARSGVAARSRRTTGPLARP